MTINSAADYRTGRVAHQRMVRKIFAAGDVEGALAHAVTRYDREQSARAVSGSYYNPNALGIYLGRVGDVAKLIKKGVPHADAINQYFNGALANRLHTVLNTGGKDIDSLRRATESALSQSRFGVVRTAPKSSR